jgi:hypothetical protein
MPVDYTPLALRGEELLIGFGDARYLVKPNGDFRRSPSKIASTSASADVKCNLRKVFGDSGYSRCIVVADLLSLKKRTLGFQNACT